MSYYTNEVFGIATNILEPSYVDRGRLDKDIQKLLSRDTHLALRGESKCGKSWLRQRNMPDAIVVQCRLNKKVKDIFIEALAILGLNYITETIKGGTTKTSITAETEGAVPLIGKIKAKLGFDTSFTSSEKSIPISNGLDDLRFIAEAINASGRRLVIEDFHYLRPAERRDFATDLKALWDYKTFVVIIGIWAENNLLLHLNPDLAARIEEKSIYWSEIELGEVLTKGSESLNIQISEGVSQALIKDSFGTVGILQRLTLSLLDEVDIERATPGNPKIISNLNAYMNVALAYAEQLNALYQTFASRLAKGIRQRKRATGIYAHMLKVVMDSSDKELTDGLHTDTIFLQAKQREPRIQKPNLRAILTKIDSLQVDDEGRGLVISYDENKDEVSIVDKQLFLYRKYATVGWPWENIIEDVALDDGSYQEEIAD